jgi:hypothetical protein
VLQVDGSFKLFRNVKNITLLGSLFFISACSNSAQTYVDSPDQTIDYDTFVGASHDFNKTENINFLNGDDIDLYKGRFNLTKDESTYQFWYLVTGITQPTGGYYYKARIKNRKISLCLQSPDAHSSVTMAFQAPLLLVGVDSDVRPIFDETCAGKMFKSGIREKPQYK